MIKKANSDQEIKQAFQVRTTVFVDEQHVPPEEELDHFDKEAVHFIVIQNDSPIAASRLRFAGDYGKLERICVLKEQRGKSYGAQLIQAMETETAKKGYRKAKLNAQTHAENFYKRLGYETVSGEFLDAGIPHVTMIKQL
ncbi:N-acetyltransferase [Lentibacillus populi]|uniref:N-acetyltransferase n=1 Tax=Lentibacillus populi TaxID=1827502 RepID=A0A9W5X530_9BACI|nr:GNAT family N-acetyltransferase [Lentibacillus populi]GGB40376.1 N-acetyltransferase [Lentibacillus populi]